MDEKLESILAEIKIMQDKIKVMNDDLHSLKDNVNTLNGKYDDLKLIVLAIKEGQDVTNAKSTVLENIQERQQRLIETLSYRSIQQETDLNEMKRMMQNQ